MKKRFSVVIALAVMLSVIAAPGLYTYAGEEDGGSTAVGTITIVHTNDIHGYYTEVSESGVLGFALLKGLIDDVDADLVVDAGDTFHGQAFATVEEGAGIAELMAYVGYDAVTPGNHDFSYGAERLRELADTYGIPILASNIKNEDERDYMSTPYVIREIGVSDDITVRVGILGVIDDAFYSSTASENVSGLSFEEEAAEAATVARTLREAEDCDIVIALTHQKDCESFVSDISGIDVVVAGHEHLLIDKEYTDAAGDSVKVVEAGYYFKNIGVLTLGIDADKNIVSGEEKAYAADGMSDITADAGTSSKIAGIESRESETLAAVVGKSEEDYAYSWEDIRIAQQDIGQIVTSAYLKRTGADMAIENAGGIRAGIPEGDITYQDIISISPYGNTLLTKEMTGQELVDMLETSIEIGIQCDEVYAKQIEAINNGGDYTQYKWPDNSGAYLQFGGISVVYDPDAAAGERVISVKVGDENLNLEKTYTVATNNYIAGNDLYPALSDADIDKEYGTCEQVLTQFVEDGGSAGLASAAAATESVLSAESGGIKNSK